MTTIDRFVPAPGRVVEFATSAATLAVAEGAPASPVPPSFNQRFHLAGAPGHWLACAFDIRGPVDTEALRTAFETFAGSARDAAQWVPFGRVRGTRAVRTARREA
ncbi:hypothetical protein ACFQ10_02430 [Streptomyces indonesiensis]